MKIRTLEHTIDGNNQELFALIGGFAMNRQVVETLGNNIYSEAGQIWLIANDGNNTLGFASLLMQQNQKGKMFNLYVTNNADEQLKAQLVKAVVKIAKQKGCVDVHIIDYTEHTDFYKSQGLVATSPRGKKFMLYVKELKND